MQLWTKAVEAITDRAPITEQQKFMLLSHAGTLDSKRMRLIEDALELHERFEQVVRRAVEGEPLNVRDDKATELRLLEAEYSSLAGSFRLMVRVVCGPAVAAEFDKELAK